MDVFLCISSSLSVCLAACLSMTVCLVVFFDYLSVSLIDFNIVNLMRSCHQVLMNKREGDDVIIDIYFCSSCLYLSMTACLLVGLDSGH